MKWLTRPEPGEVGRQVLIFAWILVCNLAVQLLHGALSAVGMPTWPIFLSNILYFLMGAPEYKERLIHCVCGGSGLCAPWDFCGPTGRYSPWVFRLCGP